ncbi:hypothetical protein J3R83DRAFT_8388 [Lanmaoa asiatica]|nr:hypothetical protein J3R83DRAFT_8388 [Lanmaoa asiatica]
MYTLTPRFILSVRELYARDVQGRRGEGVDTGFGLPSAGRGAVGTAMVFVDVEPDEGLEEDVQGRCGDGIDTGTRLGLSSSGCGAVGPAIALADVEPNKGLENVEEVSGRDVGRLGRNS